MILEFTHSNDNCQIRLPPMHVCFTRGQLSSLTSMGATNREQSVSEMAIKSGVQFQGCGDDST